MSREGASTRVQIREANLTSGKDRLLVVDDDANNRDMLSRRLERRGYLVDVAEDGPNALEKIQQAHYDLVLLDQMMPGMSGLDLLQLLRATYSSSELPVIMVTAVDQSKTVVEALSGGANDYVTKPVDMPVVAARIEAQLTRTKSEREVRSNARRTDALTGLGNREMMLGRLAATGHKGELALLLLDLDGFKIVNDTCGHAAGDKILVEIAARLQSAVADCEPAATTLTRIGGDEFAILIDPISSGGQAAELAERILLRVIRPIVVDGFRTMISASIGIVEGGGDAPPEDYLRDADLAMYHAKELGKNRWQKFHSDLLKRARGRLTLTHDLRFAVERGELFAVYQTKVNLKTREIVGFEALLRWRHAERGLLSPIEFIPIAEETGLILPIGAWILREACRQLKIWQARYSTPLTMNVNLSVKQLADPDLLGHVRGAIEQSGISPETLKLEVTESSSITEFEGAQQMLAGLRAIGVGLKLDDFGTGYSSLSCLRSLHFDSLKIDHSFISRMGSDPDTRAIVDTVIKLAHSLDMSVVAEGVEDEQQAEELVRLGCETGQGYLFSKPLDAEAIEALLESAFGLVPAADAT